MAYLLDTCILSEVWKPAPNAGVVSWLSESIEDELFLSVLTLGELQKVLDRLPSGKSRFSSRLLPVTAAVAERWGTLAATSVGTVGTFT